MKALIVFVMLFWVNPEVTPAPAPKPAAQTLPRISIALDGRSFETEDDRPWVPWGVNYYRPGTGWAPQVWKKFDPEATRRDFARMKELGVNCVRVFLTYGSFCTNPDALDEEGLAKFDQFLSIAEDAGIYVHPTGPDHWEGTPDWARADRVADERALRGLESFWSQFAARYRGRTAIFAYDLRNEPEVSWTSEPLREKWNRWIAGRYATADALARAWNTSPERLNFGELNAPDPDAANTTELLDYQLFREEMADEWTRRQAAALKASDPDALVTVGLIQWSVPALLPSVRHYSGFRPERQARLLDFLEIHFYPLDRGAYEYRSREEEERNLAYLESVIREAARPGKPVVIGEFGWYGGGKPSFGGGRHPAASEEDQARWCRRVVETTAGLAAGWLNWGPYDQPEATDVSELTGLMRPDGQLKEWGRGFMNLAARLSGARIQPRELRERPALAWNRCIISPAAGNEFREAYFHSWQEDQERQTSRGASGPSEKVSLRRVRVEPQKIDDLFANPGMGWQTFHRFANEDSNLQGLPSGSAYFRFYWREIEPRQGQIDFDRFDQLLARARDAGQRLAFRVMCTGSGQYMDAPDWLQEKGCQGIEFTYGGRERWVPDFADPIFQENHFRLIRELGERYDGHPDLDLVDIGSVGLWGEWHMSGTAATGTGQPVPLPSIEIQNAIIDAWIAAFPRTPKVVLIGSDQGMARAARDGLGWRADCLGDLGGFSLTWNHMDDYYKQQIERTGASEAWLEAPVAFESCWDLRKWKSEGWDIRHIFDYGLSLHPSYMNNKSALIPQGSHPEVERFVRRLGYRLVILSLEHTNAVAPGGPLDVQILWENVGVAPPYLDYRVGILLRKREAPSSDGLFFDAGASIRGWLPGAKTVKITLPLPDSMGMGAYDLAVGVVDPQTKRPAVRLAIDRRDAEGWYWLSQVEIESASRSSE